MSGHSHWHSIKVKKGVADAKKSQLFSKLAREISIAAREGPNPEFNSKLKMAIEKAKSINMPTENIERAIKRGSGQNEEMRLEEIILEAYGPSGAAILIEAITDNKKRTLSAVKKILSQYDGKLAGEGAVKWMFERKGAITINLNAQTELKEKEKLELLAIESGADDIVWRNDILNVYTKDKDLDKVKEILEKKGVKTESASLDWVPKEEINIDDSAKQTCQKLFEALDEDDDVQEIYSNVNLE
jgi:YebC/PmpR family DNA-binding regulatory protein